MPSITPALARSAAAALAGLLLLPAPARAGTVWLCGLSDDLTRIVCVADTDDLATAEPPAPVARVNGTTFPLDPRRQWTVNLWSPATDAEPVAQLARATLCWRSPDCEVLMNTTVLDRGGPAGPAQRSRLR